jgi:SAM-dependent methyltransferase
MKFSLNAFIYKHLIDPILSGGQKHIISKLSSSDRVLDIACGTGSLSVSISAICSEVRGIDLNEEMIGVATKSALNKNISNVQFSVADASDLSAYKDGSFSVAATSMAIHQFDGELAIRILKEMRRIAKRVIIMDYYYPLRPGFTRWAVYFIEWIAGGDHNRNFRIYNKLGGLNHFLSEAGLSIISDLHPIQAFRVVECK